MTFFKMLPTSLLLIPLKHMMPFCLVYNLVLLKPAV